MILRQPRSLTPLVAGSSRCSTGIHRSQLSSVFLDYLAEHAASIQLAMVGAAPTGEVQQLLGPLAFWACATGISPCSLSALNGRAADISDARVSSVKIASGGYSHYENVDTGAKGHQRQ